MKTKTLLMSLLIVLFAFQASAQMTESLEQELEELEEDEKIEVLIRFDEDFTDLNTDIDLYDPYDYYNISVVELEASKIHELEEMEEVQRIERDRVFETQSRSTGGLSELSIYGGLNGENVSVGVVDTGVDSSHPYLELEDSQDFTGEGTGDSDGHGTHVAGTIGSTHPLYRGVAPGSELYDLKVLNGSGSGKSSDILKALDWSKKNELDIVSMSIGSQISRCSGRDMISRASSSLAETGTVVIAAAGNEGPENSTVTAPGCSEKVITVGATDRNYRVAEFSGRGPTSDGRVKPDVVAPGTSIVSTFPNRTFRILSGTSMATPYVSGQAALMLEEDPSLTHREVKDTITGTAIDLNESANLQGHGKVNISASLNANHSLYAQQEPTRRGIFERLTVFFRGLFL